MATLAQENELPPLVIPYKNLDSLVTTFSWMDLFWVGPAKFNKRLVTVMSPELSHEQRVKHSTDWLQDRSNHRFWTWNHSIYGNQQIHYKIFEPVIQKGVERCEKKDIILVHGFTSSAYVWRFLAPWLSAAHMATVWCIDLLGSGESACPLHVNYEPTLFVEQIFDFTQAFQLGKVHLIGHSLGGGISTVLALKYPDIIQSLALIAPLLYPVEMSSWYDWMNTMSWILPLLSESMFESILRNSMSRYGTSAIWTEQDLSQQVKYITRPGGCQSVLSLLHNCDNAKLLATSQHYHRLKMPVLVVYGNTDLTTKCYGAFEFKKSCKHAEIHVLPDVGHLVLDERPLTTRRLISQFYKQNML